MTQKLMLVVDVAANAPAEEIERALAAPLENHYSLVGTVHTDGNNIRAVYKLRTRQLESDEGADFIKQNPGMSVEKIRLALAAKGIRRSKDWISKVKEDA
jgi:hypothetical protein